MAPESPNQKRKRREAANATASASATRAAGTHDHESNMDDSHHEKRGRGRRKRPETIDSPENEEPPPKRILRRSLGETMDEGVEEPLQPRRRLVRGTARKEATTSTTVAAEDATISPEVPSAKPSRVARGGPASRRRSSLPGEPVHPRRSGRERQSGDVGAENSESEAHDEDEEPPKRKRGRPSLGDAKSKPGSGRRSSSTKEPEKEPESTAPKKRRGRPSLKAAAKTDEDTTITPRRGRGRPKKSINPAPTATSSTQRPKRPSTSTDAMNHPKRRRTSTGTSAPAPATHSKEDASEPPSPPGPRKPYRHLKPHTRNIPRATIEDKWTPLEPPALAAVSSLLRQAQRPVIQRLHGDERRRDQAVSALHALTRRLTGKLARGVPFPPPHAGAGTGSRKEGGLREQELDFEGAEVGVLALEKQLGPLRDAVDLLEGEKKRLERELEQDYAVLRDLETNARAEAGWRRDRLRKAHVLVPDVKRADEKWEDGGMELVPMSERVVEGPLFKNLEDRELASLANQLGSHVESMKSNLAQVDGVLPQLARSRASLQGLLFKHLETEQYENAVLG